MLRSDKQEKNNKESMQGFNIKHIYKNSIFDTETDINDEFKTH